jgi:hypothetical protein
VAQKGAHWSRESHLPEGAFQNGDYRDVDHGVDLQGDFAGPAAAQGVPQCMSESQRKIGQTTENARETAAEILSALGKSE